MRIGHGYDVHKLVDILISLFNSFVLKKFANCCLIVG